MTLPFTLLVNWSGAPPEFLLGQRERALAARLPPWRAIEFGRVRLTARAAVLLAGFALPPGLEILKGPNGCPVLTQRTRWHVSLSHSGTATAATVERKGLPIGVDVEQHDRDLAILMPRITGRRDRLPSEVDPVLVFSCKESAYKALGGPHPKLDGYPVRIRNGRIRVGGLSAHTWTRGNWLVTNVCAARRTPTLQYACESRVIEVLSR